MYADYRAPLFAAIAATACATEGEDLSGLEARVTALEAENDQLRTDLDAALAAAEGYATDADLAAYALSTDLDDYALADDVVGVMGGVTTLDVPSQYATIAEALGSLTSQRIIGTVTIQVAPGTNYTLPQPFHVRPDCGHIIIRGAPSAPETVVLTAQGSALEVQGCKGVLIEGFTFVGSETQSGVTATNGAHVTLSDVVIRDFDQGIYAYRGSYVEALDTEATSNDIGVYATQGGYVRLQNATVTENGVGLHAQFASTIEAFGVDLSNTDNFYPASFEASYGGGSTLFGSCDGSCPDTL